MKADEGEREGKSDSLGRCPQKLPSSVHIEFVLIIEWPGRNTCKPIRNICKNKQWKGENRKRDLEIDIES